MSADSPDTPPAAAKGRESLVAQLCASLRAMIESGQYKPGDRLPSEAQLTRDHGVSRTVVREAVATLRADGLVRPRQGAGIFVTEPEVSAPFSPLELDMTSLPAVMELLELRTAIEVEAAGLAAIRRSPAQEAQILDCLHAVTAADGAEGSAEADLALHRAIAEATNNPRFGQLLQLLGAAAIPRRSLGGAASVPPDYIGKINAEHEAIVNAILDGDEEAARTAMRSHLKGSLRRYRALQRQGA
ncbi:FadR/GntR family transcriptional regulator [Poseidonocella sp. HB161398]|uniref:FadR/GntR family transcriptional regulator n=1 Tax=Poseidonocella sp. HB161398 TaxID=2320855 RepID=UPI001F10C5CB|nr:FadR/GntR family transcriptional regulator [Poseidonocella sp. HB161398]